MASSVLEKYLDIDFYQFPTILPIGARVPENLTLKEAVAKRQRSIEANPQYQDDVYVFIDADNKRIEKGKVEKFIWDLWTCDDLDDDQLNHSILESKMIHNTIPVKMTKPAINLLTHFLYNGELPEQVDFIALLDLNREVSSLNLDRQVKEAVTSALSVASSFANIRKAWKNVSSAGMSDPTLVYITVAYIICNPEQVFAGNNPWLDMPKQLLEKLVPESLAHMMEELHQYGATRERQKTFTNAGKIYIQLSHFQLLFFMVDWSKRFFSTVMNPEKNIRPSIWSLRMALGSGVKMLDPTTFDISKFNGDHRAVKNKKVFLDSINAYILLKNIFENSDDELKDPVTAEKHFNLPLPGENALGSIDAMNMQHGLDAAVQQNPEILAIEGPNMTPTLGKIAKLFGTQSLTDMVVYVERNAVKLYLHSYVIRLRQSAFSGYLNTDGGTTIEFFIGQITYVVAANFFKSFYILEHELCTSVEIDLEFCFLALLFQVDFLLEKMFMFTRGNRTCMESRVMHFVSAYRRYNDWQNHAHLQKVKAMIKDLQDDPIAVAETISFKFLFDEPMTQQLLGDYNTGRSGFYYNIISRLECSSQIQMWLRKESVKDHYDRLRNWTMNGAIRLDRVSKHELKDLAARKIVDMDGAIDYAYQIGLNEHRVS